MSSENNNKSKRSENRTKVTGKNFMIEFSGKMLALCKVNSTAGIIYIFLKIRQWGKMVFPQDSESPAKKYIEPLITQKHVLIDSLLLRGEQNAWVGMLHAEATTGGVP